MRVTIWNEYRHERVNAAVAALYPGGIHWALSSALAENGMSARFALLDEPENGLPDAVIETTGVLVWWGHAAHAEVSDAVVRRVEARVRAGMGLVCQHSAHHSKIFKALMGTSCDLRWGLTGGWERVSVVARDHPIARDVPPSFEIPQTEMYAEPFDVPAPDQLVLISGYETGDVFRSGCCYERGRGRIFYFGPGHETYPIYHQPEVRRVVANAVRWAGEKRG